MISTPLGSSGLPQIGPFQRQSELSPLPATSLFSPRLNRRLQYSSDEPSSKIALEYLGNASSPVREGSIPSNSLESKVVFDLTTPAIENKTKKQTTKGSWTKEEDERLKECVAKHGKKWTEIATLYFPSKMPAQLRHRYIEHLYPNLNLSNLTNSQRASVISQLNIIMVQPPHDSRGHIKWGKVASLINCRLGYDLARGTIVNIWITETSRKHKKRKSLALESKDGGLTELIRSPSMERASVSQDHSLTGLSYPLTSSSHYSQSQPVYPQEKFPQYLHTQETHPPIYKSIQNVNEYVIAIKELQENDRALEILKHRQQEKIDYARSVQLQVCDKQLQEYMIAHKILILKKQTQIECVRTMKKLQEFDKALELLNIKQRVETEYTRSVKELKEHDRVLKILMHKQSVDKKTFLHNVLVCQQTALPEIPVPAQTDLPITTAESAASHSASSQNMTQELNVDDFFK